MSRRNSGTSTPGDGWMPPRGGGYRPGKNTANTRPARPQLPPPGGPPPPPLNWETALSIRRAGAEVDEPTVLTALAQALFQTNETLKKLAATLADDPQRLDSLRSKIDDANQRLHSLDQSVVEIKDHLMRYTNRKSREP
jgi:hypothetical protein